MMSLDTSWRCLSDIVHRVMRSIETRKPAQLEAFFTSTQTTEVTIRNSEILAQKRADDSGVGFRAAVAGNRVGFACTNRLSNEAILEAVEKALSIARVSSESNCFALPEVCKPASVRGLFDPSIAVISVEEAVDIAERGIDAAESFDKRVKVKAGRVIFVSGWRGVVNSLGVDVEEKETRAVMYLGASGQQGGEVTGTCYETAFSRRADLKPELVGENAAKNVAAMFKPRPVKSFQGAIVFAPEAVSYQICDVLVDTLKGENVVAGRSAWAQKVCQRVASEKLTVTDNAAVENGFASRSFDDEGCPSQNTCLVEKGGLRGFLHHAGTAKALGVADTGNASRFSGGLEMVHAIVGEGYRTKPAVYPSDLTIQVGSRTKDELLAEVGRGVLVEDMGGFAQRGSGVISAQLSRAFYVEDGEIRYPIKAGMVSGLCFDWLNHVIGVGSDAKQFQNAVVPSLLVEDVKVIGA